MQQIIAFKRQKINNSGIVFDTFTELEILHNIKPFHTQHSLPELTLMYIKILYKIIV